MSSACIIVAWWTSNYHQACSVHRKIISRRKKSKISYTAWEALVPVSPWKQHYPRPPWGSYTSLSGSINFYFRKINLPALVQYGQSLILIKTKYVINTFKQNTFWRPSKPRFLSWLDLGELEQVHVSGRYREMVWGHHKGDVKLPPVQI